MAIGAADFELPDSERHGDYRHVCSSVCDAARLYFDLYTLKTPEQLDLAVWPIFARMTERGYTERQVRRLVEWYMRVNKAG